MQHCCRGGPSPLLELDNELWAHVTLHLDVRSLGRLNCVAPRFTTLCIVDPTTGAMHSLIDEGARRALEAREAYVRAWTPRDKGQRWLRLLRESDVLLAPLVFTEHGEHVHVADNTATETSGWGNLEAATCRPLMRAGRHYAEFTVVSQGECGANVGPGFSANPYPQVVFNPASVPASRTAMMMSESCVDHMVDEDNFALLLCTYEGALMSVNGDHTLFGLNKLVPRVESGEVLGMLLDFEARTLVLYRNGERKGVWATNVAGPLRWCVDVTYNSSISIAQLQPPPVASAEDLLQDKRAEELAEARWERHQRGDYSPGREAEATW